MRVSTLILTIILLAVPGAAQNEHGWTSWRGPLQNGCSTETGLPDEVAVDGEGSWSYEIAGRGTPVIHDGKVYGLGYAGDGKELEERVFCLEEKTGKLLWEHRYTDFLSDIIYHRFAIGSPTVDPVTGHVYTISTAGLLTSFTADGTLRWQRSMMSEFGRLTFPNGRTGAPIVDGELVIVHTPTSAWGAHAPARDRFYAFEKDTGLSVWSCTPGGPPKDASFSFPVLANEGGRRVMYAGLAGGHLVCVDVRTGDPLWKFQMSIGGMSTSPLLHEDRVIAIHGKENLDTSTIGRMVAVRRGAVPAPGGGQLALGKESEVWRNDLVSFTSSPVLAGDRVYQTVLTGDLYCVDAKTGRKLWHEKLAPDQIHASPAWGDGKLYVPMNNGSFHVIRPKDEGPEILQSLQLEGNCLGAPAIANGRIYVHTTRRLYCFAGGTGRAADLKDETDDTPVGRAVRLQVRPADVVFRQGEVATWNVRALDANGRLVRSGITEVAWKNLPRGITMASDGTITVDRDAPATSAVVTAISRGLTGTARIRIVRELGYTEDFSDVELGPTRSDATARVGPPPASWAGARLKWEVREVDGDKVLAKTLDRPLFQRTLTLMGQPHMSNYTIEADVRTDGNRRIMSTPGLINQRYLVRLKGNHQTIEISSNEELLKENVKFRWKAKTWYKLKCRVDMQDDGTAIVRAKAWKRGDPEPEGWLLEVKDPNGHRNGSPGVYGFTPQSRFTVYIDNITVTPNETIE